MRNSCRYLFAVSLVVCTLGCISSSLVLAAEKQSSGPTTGAPANLLRVNLVERTGALRDTATQLDQDLRKTLDALSGATDPGYRTFEETYGALMRYRRIGSELLALGEPTAEDILLRHGLYRTTLFELGRAYAEGKAAKRAVDKRLAYLPRQIAETTKKIQPAIELSKNEKWRMAYDALNANMDSVQALGFWHEVAKNSTHPTLLSWQKTSDGWFYHLSTELREEAKRLCMETIEKQQQDNATLIDNIKTFSTALAAAPAADPGTGSNVSGPQAIEYFGKLWIEEQRKAMRARGLATILEFVGTAGVPKPVVVQHADFSKKIGPALAGIILADAQRAGADEAPELYLEYLDRLPPLIARGNLSALVDLFGSPLDQLAARSPELQTGIQAYRLCTADLMRWRRRTTEAYIRAMAEPYPSLNSVIQANCQGPGQPALLVRLRTGQIRAWLYQPVPQLIEDARETFMDKPVALEDLRYFSNYALSVDADHRSVAYVSVSPDVTQSARDHLANDLFATDGFRPLSLDAAVALYTAEIGDLSAAGGVVYHIGLTSVPSIYTSQISDNRALVRLGPLREEPIAWQTKDLMLMFAVKPSWVAHSSFFVPLPQ